MLRNRASLVLLLATLSIFFFLIKFLPYQLGINLTESLPQKLFLIKKGDLPQRNDYVVFTKPNKWYKNPFVKQVIGIEGDEIKEVERKVFIINKQAKKTIFAGIIKEFSLRGEKLIKIKPGIIPQGYYYAHAPHKDSLDSRYSDIGLISKTEIIGVAKPINGYFLLIFLLSSFLLLLGFWKKK